MKIHSVLASLFLLFGVAFSNPTSRRPPVRNQVETVDSLLGEAILGVREAWEKFKNEHGKQYSESEDKSRFFAFLDAKSFADVHNKKFARGEARFHVGTNRISDLSPSEYRTLLGFRGSASSSNASCFHAPRHAEIPVAVDWRAEGFVTGVKDQGACGSCWAFAAVGALEGQYKRSSGRLISLSEQNLVDCSWSYANFGCFGGMPDRAFAFLRDQGAIDTEAAYPYKGESGECHFSSEGEAPGLRVSDFKDLPVGDEEALKAAVATVGPIAVAIDASRRSFRMYAGGIYFDDECSQALDHAVLVVGYGSDPKLGDYWLVKNSWGTEWGKGGYIRMARGEKNHCGIADKASYPLL